MLLEALYILLLIIIKAADDLMNPIYLMIPLKKIKETNSGS
jgi:hypothetical protein